LQYNGDFYVDLRFCLKAVEKNPEKITCTGATFETAATTKNVSAVRYSGSIPVAETDNEKKRKKSLPSVHFLGSVLQV
jgi:hypothetical protein